jgi:hypothetical protein
MGYSDEVEQSTKQQQIITGYNGIFVRRTEKFNGNTIAIISKTDKVPGLRSVKEGIRGEIVNKLPFSIFEELVANYRAVYRRDKTESSAQIYRLQELDPRFPGKNVGDYVVYYPKQKNSGANTNYADDADAVINLRQKHTLVMESHAHANFSAFFSGGDDNNEKAPLAYCVIGHVDSNKVSFAGRVKLMNLENRMEIGELFEVPDTIADPLAVDNLNLPEPSPVMLANANIATAVNKTAAQMEEERIKQGIVVPSKTYTYTPTNYYGKHTNYGRHYSSLFDEYDTHNYDTSKYSARNTKSDRKKSKALMKLDVEWLADNLDDNKALLLLELLTERIEKRSITKVGGLL